jgi:hypothetical protein
LILGGWELVDTDSVEFSGFWSRLFGELESEAEDFGYDSNDWGEEETPDHSCFQDDVDLLCHGVEVDEDRADSIFTAGRIGMPWKRWDKVYVSTTKFLKGRRAKLTGEEQLLIRPLRKENQKHTTTWAAVNNDREVKPLDLKNKKTRRPKKDPRYVYKEFKALSYWEKSKVERAAMDLAARYRAQPASPSDTPRKSKNEEIDKNKKKKESNAKTSSKSTDSGKKGWVDDNVKRVMSAGGVFWAWRWFGTLPALCVLGARAVSYYRLAEKMESMMETGNDVVEYAEETQEYWVAKIDWLKGLPWDIIFTACVLAIILAHALYSKLATTDGNDAEVSSQGDSASDNDSDAEDDETELSKKMRADMMGVQSQLDRLIMAQSRVNPAESSQQAARAEQGRAQQDLAVRDLMRRVQIHEDLIKADAMRARREEEPSASTGPVRRTVPLSGASKFVDELRSANIDIKEQVQDQLEKVSDDVPWRQAHDMKERVAPMLTAKIYKNGDTALRYVDRWIEEKQLGKSSVVGEVRLLARSLDADNEDASLDSLNKHSYEMRASKLYGYFRAFENVKKESDWRRPSGQNARGHKSKVNWAYLDMYDAPTMEQTSLVNPDTDRERVGLMSRIVENDKIAQQAMSHDHTGVVHAISHSDD